MLTLIISELQVANVPLVFGIEPPKELFEVDQDKVYALTINPTFLKSIRLARSRSLGMGASSRLSYSDMEHICKELEYSRKLFLQNPQWPVVEVTGKAIEETAAVILRIYHERCSKHHMPRISRRY
jgi:regulator of PEP synthase PpsR (kinase-PPPase family)